MKRIPSILRTPLVRFIAARSESCLAVTRKMSDSLDRRLTLRERFEVRLHSLICDACVRYLKQIRLVHTEAGHLAMGEPERGLNEAAKETIRGKLRVG